jgi:hypothetical protein
MKLLIESLMVLLSTLLAAALITLGEPARAELSVARAAASALPVAQVLAEGAFDVPAAMQAASPGPDEDAAVWAPAH